MATFEKRTTQDGKQVWRVKVRRKDHPTQSATFSKLTEARKWAQITEGAVLSGRHFKSAEAKRHTVGEMIDRYLIDVLPHKRPNTVRPQQWHFHWWKSCLDHVPLADLTPTVIAEYRDKLAKGDGARRANATVNRYLAALSHALSVAVKEWGWLDESPMGKVRKPKEPQGRIRFLTDDEKQRLLDACKESESPYLYTIVVLALATGARKMEVLTLTWRDVDLKRGLVTVQETKNGERRTLPLTGHAFDLIQQHARVQRPDTALLFPSPSGKSPRDIRSAWKTALKRAGITRFRFHDLRHTAASYLAMNGASLMEIAEVLGHKTLNMVKRYAHLSEAHTRGVVERMNRAVFGE
jgi:integrase